MNMKKYSVIMLILLLVLLAGLTACGGNNEPTPTAQPAAQATHGDPAKGEELFTSCAACHGPAGEGVPGLGADMTASTFIAGKTDVELVEFIKVGREATDPTNKVGIAMPPKGANPGLTDEDLYDIVAYIRTLQK